MKYRTAFAFLVSLLLAGCSTSAEVSANKASELESRDDLLSMKHGAVLLRTSGQWNDTGETSFHLFDDCAYTKWSSAEGKAWNNKFVIELQNPCRITDILINNEHGASSAYPDMLAKTVRVMASATAPDSGYEQLAEVVLDRAGSKRITFDKKSGETTDKPYKWLRFVVEDNWGDKDSTQLYEIQAYGEPVIGGAVGGAVGGADGRSSVTDSSRKPRFIDGVFGGTWWPLKFVTEGNVLFGCACKSYKSDEDMLGSIQGNQARVFMPLIEGPGVAILNQSANGEVVNISRYYQFSPKSSTSNLFALQKRIEPPSCDHEPIKNVETLIGKYLTRYHKAILYGIDFKADSAELTPESDTTLNAIVSLMKSKPDLRLSVEAHNGWTDSNPIKNISLDFHDDSIESHNKLSEARAKTVVKWLCDHEVDPSRLKAKGWGKDKPVWVDGVETPRQSLILNRRIELVDSSKSETIKGRFGDF